MTRILCTCPPMIRQIELLRDDFERFGGEVVCPEFEQTLTKDELLELVPQFDGWIIGDDPATAEVFSAGRRGKLKAAIKWGAGTDNVDFDGAKSANIPVTNTPGTFGEAVSDVAIGYLIGIARGLFQIDRGVRSGGWPKPTGTILKGKTVALVGLGFIGKTIASKLHALGLNVIGYDPLAPIEIVPFIERAAWPQRISEADFILLACALSPENTHMINTETLGQTKPGVYIINVGRGPLIDENALDCFLNKQHVKGAALEVQELEPLPKTSPLRKYEQVVFGSHNSSNAYEAVIETSRIAIDKLFNFLSS